MLTSEFPKKIHMTCKNKDVLEKSTVFSPFGQKIDCLENYKQMYHDYTICIYYDEDIYELIKNLYPEDYDFIKNVKGVMLSDMFRYLILYLEGGIYSDLDCNPIKHIKTLWDALYFHGDTARDNHFYIYPKDKPILNKQWDFYENPCDNCKLVKEEDITTYQCLGHNYITAKTNIIIGKENFNCHNEHTPSHNTSRLCQWFLMSKIKQDIFLQCYKLCVSNLKEKHNNSMAIKKNDIECATEHFIEVISTTGPIFFTNVINKNLPNEEICILPEDFFCIGSGSDKSNYVAISHNSCAQHLFGNSWGLNK